MGQTQPRRRAGTRPFGGPQGGSQPRGHCLRWLRVDLRAERLDWVPAVLASLDRPFVIEQPDELRGLVIALAERLTASARAG